MGADLVLKTLGGWPMMIVTATILRASLGSNFWILGEMADFAKNPNISELKSHSCGHTPFHTHIN